MRLICKELTYDSLADVDCGSLPQPKFRQQERVAGARIPKLEEVLSLVRGAAYPVQVSVEIKLQRPELALPVEELAELLVGLIRRYELEERTIVQSFEPSALMAVRRLAPGIRPRASSAKTAIPPPPLWPTMKMGLPG